MNSTANSPVLAPTLDEQILFTSLRANDWQSFVGQETIKRSLNVAITAAQARKEALDHTLFYGPPGLGKTTLAHLIAKSLQTNLRISAGTALTKTGDIAALLSSLSMGDVLFIDEIHRLRKPLEEMLYSVMEDFALDIVIGKGAGARTMRLDIPPFTLVGATTQFGSLSGPFRDRFGIIHRIEPYQVIDIAQIITIAAEKLTITLAPTATTSLANRSRFTPRVALKLLKRVRDVAQLQGISPISESLVDEALHYFGIDQRGLTALDRDYLALISTHHQGGPIGLSTLAASLQEDPVTLEEVVEPFLLQLGLIKKTPKGRMLVN